MNKTIDIVKRTVHNLNPKKGEWSFLTSIEYMIESRLYVESLYKDAKQVLAYADDRDNFKIFDFGTGSGIFAVVLRDFIKNSQISAIDTVRNKSQSDSRFDDASLQQKLIYEEFGKIFKINFSHYDGRKMPFPDSYFDIITAYAVIEHIAPEDLDFAMNELKRILKPDGLLAVFKLPRKLAVQEYIAPMLGFGKHDKLYGDSEIKMFFDKHSFGVKKMYKSNMIFEYPGNITNKIYYLLKLLDYLLYYSPLRFFAHYNNFLLKKIN